MEVPRAKPHASALCLSHAKARKEILVCRSCFDRSLSLITGHFREVAWSRRPGRVGSTPRVVCKQRSDERAALVALMREMVEVDCTKVPMGCNRLMRNFVWYCRIRAHGPSWLIQNKSVFKTKVLWSLANGRHHHLLHCDFEIIFTVECDVEPVLNVGERPEFDDYR